MSIWVKKDMFGDVIPKRCSGLLDSAYKFLLSYAYINFGVALAIKNRIPAEPSYCFGGMKAYRWKVYKKIMEGGNKYTLHKMSDQCPLYRVDGKSVDEYLDEKLDAAYNELLEKESKVRQKLS
ncbi:hypothetical protein KY285_031914 [Solanum tuberosum]|nr:hypothetical protein KY285_031914 [Solanum tuberosum]